MRKASRGWPDAMRPLLLGAACLLLRSNHPVPSAAAQRGRLAGSAPVSDAPGLSSVMAATSKPCRVARRSYRTAKASAATPPWPDPATDKLSVNAERFRSVPCCLVHVQVQQQENVR